MYCPSLKELHNIAVDTDIMTTLSLYYITSYC